MAVYSTLSHSQKVVLALMPKVTGLLSLICSCVIVLSVLGSPQKRARVYHRLILGISLYDISNSTFFGLSTWPIPSSSGYLWAIGSEQSCIAQGFFIQLGNSAALFNGSLAMYYLLFFQYDWRERHFRKYEILLYGIPIIWGVGTAILGLPLRLYNNANLWCWIAPFPSNCESEPMTCIRGNHATWYRWGFYYIPLWIMIILVTYSQVVVIYKVRSNLRQYKTEENDETEQNGLSVVQTDAMPEERKDPTMDVTAMLRKTAEKLERERRSKEIATQCLLYALSFYLNWFALTTVRILQAMNKQVEFQLLVVAATVTPFQGLPNLLVYIYPNFLNERRLDPNGNVFLWLDRSLRK